MKEKIQSIDMNADKIVKNFISETVDCSRGIFVGIDLLKSFNERIDSTAYATTAKNLQTIALAYATLDSKYYHNEDIKNKVRWTSIFFMNIF